MSVIIINPEVSFAALSELQDAVREMTLSRARPSSAQAGCVNVLARPVSQSTVRCIICQFPGHQSSAAQDTNRNYTNASACRIAITNAIAFWERVLENIAVLQEESPEFRTALEQNVATAEMQWDTQPQIVAGSTITVILYRLSANYLKFQRFYTRLGLKLPKILNAQEIKRYQVMSEGVDSYLLPGGYRELKLGLSRSGSLII